MKILVFSLCIVGALGAPSTKAKFTRGVSRIIGGTDASAGEIPYQVSVQDTSYGFGFHFCGGSIYSEGVVISAAHCTLGEEDPSELTVVAGERDLSSVEGTEQTVPLSSILHHPQYDYHSMENDLSLLFLSTPLSFTDYIQPIPLPQQLQSSSGEGLVSGWGTTSVGGSIESILQKITVPIITDDTCRNAYGTEKIKDSMMCAGLSQGGEDACSGDSGGPMVCVGAEGSRYLCGVISWAYGCANPSYPGVYTEVAYFVDWIQQHS